MSSFAAVSGTEVFLGLINAFQVLGLAYLARGQAQNGRRLREHVEEEERRSGFDRRSP